MMKAQEMDMYQFQINNAKRQLKREMFAHVITRLTNYREDVIFDFEFVDNDMTVDGKYIWLLRSTGTDIGKYSDLQDPESWTYLTVPHSEWAFIIEGLTLVKEVPIAELKASVK